MNELEIPRMTIRRNVPDNGGVSRPSKSKARKTPVAPIGISPYSTRFFEILPTSIDPTPIPTDKTVSGRPEAASDSCKIALAYTSKFCPKRLATVQKRTSMGMAMRSIRSDRIVAQAHRTVVPTPPAVRAGDTCGTPKAVIRPMTASPVNASGASQV